MNKRQLLKLAMQHAICINRYIKANIISDLDLNNINDFTNSDKLKYNFYWTKGEVIPIMNTRPVYYINLDRQAQKSLDPDKLKKTIAKYKPINEYHTGNYIYKVNEHRFWLILASLFN